MLLVTLAAAVLAVAQPAPPVGTSAILSTPREVALTLDGHIWRCDASGQCVGRGGKCGIGMGPVAVRSGC